MKGTGTDTVYSITQMYFELIKKWSVYSGASGSAQYVLSSEETIRAGNAFFSFFGQLTITAS